MPGLDSPTPRELEQTLTLRFTLLLLLFVALLGGTWALVSSGVAAKEHDSLLLNLAGRQRMLIQKFTREINQAVAAATAADVAQAAETREQATRTAGLYEATLEALLAGGEVDAGGGRPILLPPMRDSEIAEQLRKARAEWEGLRSAAERAAAAEAASRNGLLRTVDTYTAAAVREMNRAVSLMQGRSEAKLRRVQSYMGAAALLGVLLFVGTVAFVRSQIVVPLADTLSALAVTNEGLQKEIAERRTLDAALRERELMLRSILETAADGIVVINEQGRILSFNHVAEAIFGYPAAEVLGQDLAMLMPAPFRSEHESHVERYLRTGERRVIGRGREVVGRRKDGSVFPMELAVGEARLEGQRIFSGIVRDLEQGREKDDRLARLLKVFDDAADPFIIGDLEGRMLEVNDEAVRAYGFKRADLIGQSMKTLVPPERHAEMDELLERCRAGGEVRSVEVVRRARSGELFPVLLTLSLLTNEAGAPIAIASLAKDISARKELQEQLLQAQKLEAIAILAGGIAHDFNNLLTSIRGSGEILIDQLEPGGRLARSAGRILKAADRAAALTSRLLGFSRRQVTQRLPLDLNQAVREVQDLCARILPEDVEWKADACSTVLGVLADEGQLEQVLMNLVVNAADAMPAGGTLHVSTFREEIAGERAQQLGLPPGRYGVVRVRDAGEGIPAELLPRIFDPFFTTKPVGKGTGLGLSTVARIVREHGGAIAVESEVGVGSTFTVLLPEIDARPAEAAVESRTVAPPRAAGETLLLVEDDEIMRDLVREVLEERGYAVLVAGNPAEALVESGAHDGEIALLLTDVVMPGMSGFQLADELRLRHPQIRVLFMSGYTDRMLTERGKLNADDPFIRKPFGNDSLCRKVREVLDAQPPGSA